MIEGPHIFGFSPVALCINLTSALASARLVSSVSASINAATLSWVGLVLLSAISSSFPAISKANPAQRKAQLDLQAAEKLSRDTRSRHRCFQRPQGWGALARLPTTGRFTARQHGSALLFLKHVGHSLERNVHFGIAAGCGRIHRCRNSFHVQSDNRPLRFC